MTTDREFRIVRDHGRWSAQVRFTASDAELREQSILPGWHTFRSSRHLGVAKRSIELAKTETRAA